MQNHVAPPSADAINQAYEATLIACQETVSKVLECGQLLLEQRADMTSSHSGKRSWHDGFKPEDEKFTTWLETNCPQISKTTAYRWMDVAWRVFSFLELGPVNDIPLSLLLADPESSARQTLDQYLSGKDSIKAALAGVVVGGDDASRITRALNGSEHGGSNGEDRKDYPLFIAKKLHDATAHFAHWESMTETQKTEAKTIIGNMILGRETNLAGRKGGLIQSKTVWPEDLCLAVKEAINDRLRAGK